MVSQKLGGKIRFFRERSHKSQLELESEISASSGQISRIEKGVINPTKETIANIARVLVLSELEMNYLIGDISEPVSMSEVEKAREEVKDFMEKRFTLAYMVDERSRVWQASKAFLRFIKMKPEEAENIYGISLITLLLDPKYNLINLIPKDEQFEVLFNLFCRTYRELSFMVGDKYYEEAIQQINANEVAKKAWEKVVTNKVRDIHSLETRRVYFKVGPVKVAMYYSVEPVLNNERFRVVEYIPTSKVLKLLKNL